MKPVSVKFKCFGPYMDEQYVDFEELSSKGIFLICGETGSGKTTILDAICYALFGKSSGGLRGDIEVMRCKSAKPSDETYVEYIFDSNGNRYRFHRELRLSRTRINEYDGCEIMRDGVFVPLLENPKKTAVNKKAEEIIGLTYEQFCQVIILPQGKFEKLLVSNSEEKEAILTSLFHAERWNSIVAGVKQHVDAEMKRLEEESNDIKSKLGVYNCTSLETLKEKCDELKKEITNLKDEVKTAEIQKEEAAAKYEKAIEINQLFLNLQTCQNRLKELTEKSAYFEKERDGLKRADAADSIREVYKSYTDAKNNEKAASAKAKEAEQRLSDSEATWKTAKEREEKHMADRSSYEKNKQELTRLVDARPVYSSIYEKKKAADDLARVVILKEKEAADAKTAYDNSVKAWDKAKTANDEAIAQYQRISTMYADNISGILAKELKAGEPCPVCGSITHPAPATTKCDSIISYDDVNEANGKVESTSTSLRAAKEKRDSKEAAKTLADKGLLKWKEEHIAAQKVYEAANSNIIAGIADSASLEGKIKEKEILIEDYETAEENISGVIEKATAVRTAARQHLEDAKQKMSETLETSEKNKVEWNLALAEKGFADEQTFSAALLDKEVLIAQRDKIADYDASLKSAQTALSEQENRVKNYSAPDMENLDRTKKEAESVYTEKKTILATKENYLKDAELMLKNLSKRWTRNNADRILAEDNADFAKKLNPSSGMSLQRYVLGIMLTSITASANQLLKSVHSGRYQLLRSYEASGNVRKAGLELDILDNSNGEKRSVTTLSGGEKFLVALSLAIGLSTVVQAQSGGTRLEAMFIDEGFGSLDNDSINDALDVLQGIQKSHGLVGIISHVDKLTETISTRIEVERSVSGNKIKCIL